MASLARIKCCKYTPLQQLIRSIPVHAKALAYNSLADIMGDFLVGVMLIST